MIKSWSAIERFYSDLGPQFSEAFFREAVAAVRSLAAYIANGPLDPTLFGWTSMQDLCIQQTDVEPYSGPFLRVSPQRGGAVEFRYHDTAIEGRQWSRLVPPEAVIGRFEAFLNQLHWMGRRF